MLYDRPVKDLLADALDELTEPYSRETVRRWFGAKYPKVQPPTVSAHMIAYTANDTNRRHRPPSSWPLCVARRAAE